MRRTLKGWRESKSKNIYHSPHYRLTVAVKVWPSQGYGTWFTSAGCDSFHRFNAVNIVLPSLVLAYFGAASVDDIQKNKQVELSAQGAAAARIFIDRITAFFIG